MLVLGRVYSYTVLYLYHQEFQVPKMEDFMNLKFSAILGVGFPVSISRIHTAYIGFCTSILGT